MKLDLKNWTAGSLDDRKLMVEQIVSSLEEEFVLDTTSLEHLAPRLRNAANGIYFRVIFSHMAQIGFSDIDEMKALRIAAPLQANIDEMRPCTEVEVAPFLVMEGPVREELAAQLLHRDIEKEKTYPAFLSKHDAEICLKACGGQLPTEVQWEATCRATSKTLFTFGDVVPDEATLSRWFEFDLDKAASTSNAFGVHGLFFGEWCRDHYSMSHAPDAPVLEDSFVIKGGGAYFWPWQDDEWVWCLSAMRMPSSDLIDGTSVCRAVIELPL